MDNSVKRSHSYLPTSFVILPQLKNWFANSRRRLRKEEPKFPNVKDPRKKGDPTSPNNQTETYFPSFSREESFVRQTSTTCSNNTTQHLTHEVPLSDQSPWKQENLTSLDQSSSPSSPIGSLWKTDDGIPTVDQWSPHSFPSNEIEDVPPQRYENSLQRQVVIGREDGAGIGVNEG